MQPYQTISHGNSVTIVTMEDKQSMNHTRLTPRQKCYDNLKLGSKVRSHLSEQALTKRWSYNRNVQISKLVYKSEYFPFNAQQNIIITGFRITEIQISNFPLYSVFHHCVLMCA